MEVGKTTISVALTLVFLSGHISAVIGTQASPAPQPFVINTRLAATDRALWGKGEWFSVGEYHELGRLSYEKVTIRRRDNDKTGTWESGLELSATTSDQQSVQLKIRITVRNPKGNHDKLVMFLVEVLQGDRTVTTAKLRFDAEESDYGSSQTTFQLPMEVLTGQPAPTLRLTMTTKNS